MTMPTAHIFLRLPILFIIFNLITTLMPSALCDDAAQYTECRNTYDCGLLKNITYPFWAANGRPQHCGREGYQLTCLDDQNTVIRIEDQDFLVLDISKEVYIITIARLDLWDSPCPSRLVNTTLDYDRFAYVQAVRNLTLYYGCVPNRETVPNNFTCKIEGTQKDRAFYIDESISRLTPHQNETLCFNNISVPIMWTGVDLLHQNRTVDGLQQVLKQGFKVEYKANWELCGPCMRSNGTCGSNITTDSFLCFCGGHPYEETCPNSEDNSWSWNWKRKVIIGAFAAASGILLSVIVCCIKSRMQTFMRTKSHQDLEAFIQNNGPLAVKRYKFSDIRKMTNSFKDKLGRGGYGDVYKGKLRDGCLVAVKVLNASKGNGEDFINEVASISRTSHVNVVTLLGYCFEGQKKALIYEFMPNGSLEKFIYKEISLKTTPHLELEKLFEIAIGIARGLEYLHRGCNTRILHFDIKPHNILLDDNFCPKISDFGLSKLCLKESIMSMLDARGTIGYIAPEVFCRNFGGVSVKSDVYSYGMMILEVAGGRKNSDVQVSHTTDAFFPDWIYKHLEQGSSNLGLPNPMTQEENELARKMILVGLWCIQTKPSDRPSMSKVIEMLEGSIEALQIPPKPFLTSPIRTPAESESSTFSLIC
ncbi:PREDICTED: LEAF RUST 10 DISEASE-RESISTANCE LOCUS RECEPTOR-LIKE PROTEIN KINASE-like 2.1 [Prunus mume]|uniref:non-specific serine/threonine protein kinase n=1 Tax=Prunus mume TaxID=102107 RepID=A0ABM0PIV5_PRUMU|nr:PREDICTED: LEAF RUST 10 DISEASE-RESISTANCE LOCUS RECEPTOR-LIKE PROTEIN KINASE-like 2.1 [Prunus mume]